MPLFGRKRQDISGVENWGMDQITDYLSNSVRTSGSNSQRFSDVFHATSRLEKIKQEQVSEPGAQALVLYNEQLTKACQDYIESHKGPITQQGKDRLKVMQRLLEIQETNKTAVNQMRDLRTVRDCHGMSWEQALEKTPVATAAIGPDTKVLGENASVRFQVTYNGKRGFFTEQTYALPPAVQTRNSIEKVQDPTVQELLKKNSRWIAAKMTKAFNGDLCEDMGFPRDGGKPTVELVDRSLEQEIERLSESTVEAAITARENLEQLRANPAALKACTDILAEEVKLTTAMEAGGFEPDGSSITDRNIATSRMAALLGIDKIAAHSERMVVTRDGKQIEGCFMEFAEGMDIRSEDTKKRFDHVVVDLNAGFNRDHSTLEVFDYICRQRDRHVGNMFYKLSRPEADGTRRIVGLQGIDNDLAFSDVTSVGKGNRLEQLHLIDKDLADRVQGLSRFDLEYAVGDLIGKKELDALENRINALKDHLKDMATLSGDEWKLDRYKGEEMPSPKDPSLSSEEKAYVKGIEVLKEAASAGALHRGGMVRHELELNAVDLEIDTLYAMEGVKDLFAEAEGRESERKSIEDVRNEFWAEKDAKKAAEQRARQEALRKANAAQQLLENDNEFQEQQAKQKEAAAKGEWRKAEKMSFKQLEAEQKKERPTIGKHREEQKKERPTIGKHREEKMKEPERTAGPAMKR